MQTRLESEEKQKKVNIDAYANYVNEHSNVIVSYLAEISDYYTHIGKLFADKINIKQIFCESQNDMKCDVIFIPQILSTDMLLKIEGTSPTFYARCNDKLFYVYKETNIVVDVTDEYQLDKIKLKQFDRLFKNKKNNKEIDDSKLGKIKNITGHDRTTLYENLCKTLGDPLVFDTFENLFNDWNPLKASDAYSTVNDIARLLFEPILKNQSWIDYWRKQCSLLNGAIKNQDSLQDELDDIYHAESIYNAVMNGFCYKIFLLWSKQYTKYLTDEIRVKSKIFIKILHQSSVQDFILFCKNDVKKDCNKYLPLLAREIREKRNNPSYVDRKLSILEKHPRDNLYFKLLDNGNKIIDDCLNEWSNTESMIQDQIRNTMIEPCTNNNALNVNQQLNHIRQRSKRRSTSHKEIRNTHAVEVNHIPLRTGDTLERSITSLKNLAQFDTIKYTIPPSRTPIHLDVPTESSSSRVMLQSLLTSSRSECSTSPQDNITQAASLYTNTGSPKGDSLDNVSLFKQEKHGKLKQNVKKPEYSLVVSSGACPPSGSVGEFTIFVVKKKKHNGCKSANEINANISSSESSINAKGR